MDGDGRRASLPGVRLPAAEGSQQRQETIEEILDIAVQIMAEQGVAGLSIGEIGRASCRERV